MHSADITDCDIEWDMSKCWRYVDKQRNAQKEKSMRKMIMGFIMVVLGTATLLTSGCRATEEAVDETGDVLESVGDAAADAVDDAGDEVEKAVHEVDRGL